MRKQREPERRLIADSAKEYLQYLEDRLIAWRAGAKHDGISPNSKATYSRTVRDFVTYCSEHGIAYIPKSDKPDEPAADEISREVLLDYKLHLYKTLPRCKGGQQSETIATRFRNLSAFFTFCRIRMAQSRQHSDGRKLLAYNEKPRANNDAPVEV